MSTITSLHKLLLHSFACPGKGLCLSIPVRRALDWHVTRHGSRNRPPNSLETFPHAEERRLFYVALTRAKKDVYLMVNRESKSAFIREIEKEYGINDSSAPGQEPCPKCRTGTLIRRQSTYGAFYGCSHYPRCEYTRNIYSNQSRKRKIRL